MRSDCGWRLAETVAPCVHCGEPTYGRTTDGVVTHFGCYHNVGVNCDAVECGTEYEAPDAVR